MIIDYDVWAESPSTGLVETPKIPRSALTEDEARQQAEEFVEKIKTSSDIKDWVPKWKPISI